MISAEDLSPILLLIPAGSFVPVGSHWKYSDILLFNDGELQSEVEMKITETVGGFEFAIKLKDFLTGPVSSFPNTFLRIGADVVNEEVSLEGVLIFPESND